MEDYTSTLIVFLILIGLNFFFIYSYYNTYSKNENVPEKVERKAIAIWIFSQGLIGITLGSVLLFKIIPGIGAFIQAVLGDTEFSNAINTEESFIINFCVFFSLLAISLFNGVYPYWFKSFIDFTRKQSYNDSQE